MIEIWKTLIVRILSWPVAAVVLGLIFRRHISGLLARATHFSVKHGDTSLEASAGETAFAQIKKAGNLDPAANPASLTASTVRNEFPESLVESARPHFTDPEDEIDRSARQQMVDFGKGIAAVQIGEEAIRGHLAKMHFDLNSDETTEVLIRNLAVNQALAAAERLYRLIFGSQISALKTLNTVGPKPDSTLREFYEKARRKFPRFYQNYSYKQWLDFLISQRILVHDPEADKFGINQAGRDFLSWIVSQGLTEDKAG